MHPLWTKIAPALTEPQLLLMDRYLDALIEKNASLNLTRITDRTQAEIKHVADALTLLAHIPPGTRTLADVGTGGGIPGVVLAIARPELRVTLIDATNKKLDAVMSFCAALEVTNVTALHARVEEVDAQYDVVTARAVADLATLLRWCQGLMSRSSRLLAMKGPRVVDELAAIPTRQRKRWTIDVHDVAPEPLHGHRIVVAKRIA